MTQRSKRQSQSGIRQTRVSRGLYVYMLTLPNALLSAWEYSRDRLFVSGVWVMIHPPKLYPLVQDYMGGDAPLPYGVALTSSSNSEVALVAEEQPSNKLSSPLFPGKANTMEALSLYH